MPREMRLAQSSRDLEALLDGGRLAGLTDGELLDRFVAHRDEAAIAALVRRHGAMVLGVCRRVLANPHDADDAFQATWLVLARRAGVVRPADGVARWLHGVALRTAQKARARRARRLGREVVGIEPVAEVAAPVVGADPDQAELLGQLDRAIAALPGRYRAPVVLCLLEGQTHREAADHLGWPIGTVSGRLSRGRALLARRVRASTAGRGGGPLALPPLVGPSLPPAQVAATARAALLWGLGRPALSTIEMAPTLLLTREVIQSMMMTKIRLTGVLVLGTGLVLGGGVGVGLGPTAPALPANAADTPPNPALKPLQGLWTGTLTEPSFPRPDAESRERARLGLAWSPTKSVVEPGPPRPGLEPPVQVLVEGDRLAVRGLLWGRVLGFSVDSVMKFRATLRSDPSTDHGKEEPGAPLPEGVQMIDLADEPEPDDILPTISRGIYRLDDDSLQLCLSLPNKRRPARLAVEPKTNQILLTLRRTPDRTWGDIRDDDRRVYHEPEVLAPPETRTVDPITKRPILPKQPNVEGRTTANPAQRASDSATRAEIGSKRPFLYTHTTVDGKLDEPPLLPVPPASGEKPNDDLRRIIDQAVREIGEAPVEARPNLLEAFYRRLFALERPPVGDFDGIDVAKMETMVIPPRDGSMETELAVALGKVVRCRVISHEVVTKDAMVLNYLPDWNFGTVDNIGVGNQHGGNWTLVDWKPISPEESKNPIRRFFLAFYSRTTHSGPDDPGKIQASEILNEWPEVVSWRTKPEISAETAASFRFEPGDGWKLLDITDLIRGRARQNRVGRGIALRFLLTNPHAEAPLSDYQMVSREADGEWRSKRPQLLVVEPLSASAKP